MQKGRLFFLSPPSVVDFRHRYAYNRTEASQQTTLQQERQVRRYQFAGQAQRSLAVYSRVQNLFGFGRH